MLALLPDNPSRGELQTEYRQWENAVNTRGGVAIGGTRYSVQLVFVDVTPTEYAGDTSELLPRQLSTSGTDYAIRVRTRPGALEIVNRAGDVVWREQGS